MAGGKCAVGRWISFERVRDWRRSDYEHPASANDCPLFTVASQLALLACANVRFFGSTEMGFQHVRTRDDCRIYRRIGDHGCKPPAGMEDLPQQIWRGAFLPHAAHARHRCGSLARIRNHEQVAPAHRDERFGASADIVVAWDEVEI